MSQTKAATHGGSLLQVMREQSLYNARPNEDGRYHPTLQKIDKLPDIAPALRLQFHGIGLNLPEVIQQRHISHIQRTRNYLMPR
jgi:hypothetical protein